VGSRKVKDEQQWRQFFSDGNSTIKPADNMAKLYGNVQLEGLEGFILSRITEPMPLSTAFSLITLPESQYLPALYSLCISGLLVIDRKDTKKAATASNSASSSTVNSSSASSNSSSRSAPEPTPRRESAASAPVDDDAKLQQEVKQLLVFFASADYYEILGITRRASEADIKKAYYQLAKKFHPDRAYKGGSDELKLGLEKLFAKASEAYEKLRDPDERRRYDDRIRNKPESAGTPPPIGQVLRPTPPSRPAAPPSPAPTAPPPSAPRPAPPPPPSTNTPPVSRPAATPPAAATSAAAPSPVASTPPATPAARPVAAAPTTAVAAGSATATANAPAAKPSKPVDIGEASFNQAKAALAQQDLARAAYLLREAVNANIANKEYRWQLINVLMKNPKWHKEAEEMLLVLLDQDARDANAHATLGLIYKTAGIASRAETKFRDALLIDNANKIARRELKEIKNQKASDLAQAKRAGNPIAMIKDKWETLPPAAQMGIMLGAALVVLYFGFNYLFG
jgi:DnaJ-domain-containing protein 1